MAVAREHDERKSEILDAAQGLFTSRGYDATPVSAIIDRVGVSKGTFYHYFKSKEELLDCLALRVTEDILAQTREATTAEMDAVSKLNTFFAVAGRWKVANLGVILMLVRAMYWDKNLLLRHKLTARMVRMCSPHLAEIIAQGGAEGAFDVACPEDAAEYIFHLSVAMRESTAKLLIELEDHPEVWPLLERKISGIETAIERVLGARKGSVVVADRDVMEAFHDQMISGGVVDTERV